MMLTIGYILKREGDYVIKMYVYEGEILCLVFI